MTWMQEADGGGGLAAVVEGRAREIDGFAVRRVLPAIGARQIGPFVFLDHIGPASVPPGAGLDVRPHPHINLATVTYLFEGEILHRDSLGSEQIIRPGEINWMTAGRGIVHSERTPPAARAKGARMHGLQIWVALPDEHEEDDPEFFHHDAAALPVLRADGVRVDVLVGSAYGVTSPVQTRSPMVYANVALEHGRWFVPPAEHAERAVYVVSGALRSASGGAIDHVGPGE